MTRLEEKITHQDAVIEDLSDIVRAQADQIARLNKRVQLLLQRAAEAEADSTGTLPIADQKPPHW